MSESEWKDSSRRTLAQLERDYALRQRRASGVTARSDEDDEALSDSQVSSSSVSITTSRSLDVEPPRFAWHQEFQGPAREAEYRRCEVKDLLQRRVARFSYLMAALSAAWATPALGAAWAGGANAGFVSLMAGVGVLWLACAALAAIARRWRLQLCWTEACFGATFALTTCALALALGGRSWPGVFSEAGVASGVLSQQAVLAAHVMLLQATIAVFIPLRPLLYACVVAPSALASLGAELLAHGGAAGAQRARAATGGCALKCAALSAEQSRAVDAALAAVLSLCLLAFTALTIFIRAHLARSHREMWHALRSVDASATQLRALARAEARRESKLESAQAATQARSRLVRVVMHDLRSPLLSIETAAKALLALPAGTPTDSARAAEMLHVVSACSSLTQGIVSDMLDFERMDSGRLVLVRSVFTARGLLDAALRSIVGNASWKGVKVECEPLPPELEDVQFVGDARRLLQCLNNGLSNAIKFNDPGGVVRLRASREPADAASRGALVIDVVDDGIGIGAAELATLRSGQDFAQVGQGQLGGRGGTGLGLSIVRQLLALHECGCALHIYSAGAGLGTTFRLTLPLAEAGADAAAAAGSALLADSSTRVGDWHLASPNRDLRPPAHSPGLASRSLASAPPQPLVVAPPALARGCAAARGDGDGDGVGCARGRSDSPPRAPCERLRVRTPPVAGAATPSHDAPQSRPALAFHSSFRALHVEDDMMLQMMIGSSVFDAIGVPHDTAADGAECLRRMLEEGVRYDIVLMDNQMPTMRGDEATRRLRAAGYDGIIIGMTGDPQGSPDRDEFEACGLTACVDKDPTGMQYVRDVLCSLAMPPPASMLADDGAAGSGAASFNDAPEV